MTNRNSGINFGIDNPEEYLTPEQINNYQGTPEETDGYYEAFIEPRPPSNTNANDNQEEPTTPTKRV